VVPVRAVMALGLALALLVGLPIVGGTGAPSVEASDAIKAYVPITPTRILDTRQPGQGGSFTHGQTRSLQVAGTSAVPAGAVAVAMNVTVTGPTADGFLTVWQSDKPQPNTSNLNFVAAETVPNLVTVGVSGGGQVSINDYLYAQSGMVDVIVDVVGWYVAGFNPIVPSRVMDTRQGLGGFKLGPGETRELTIQGAGNLPPVAIGAVALNVTSVNPTGQGGYLTIWPTGRSMPNASSLNFGPGEIAANAVITGVGSGGKISIYNFSGSTDVLVDVTGWFSVGYDALTPFRVLDTRQPGQVILGPGETRTINVLGVGGVPTDGVGAVALNVTAAIPTEAGFLTIWPDGRAMPNASSLNFVAGQTVPNAVVSGVGSNGRIAIHNPFGSVHVIVDITGWFALSDTEGPVLRSLSLSPSVINTAAGSQNIVVTARVTDDLAGTGVNRNLFEIRFRSPSGNQFVGTSMFDTDRISGNDLDGTYQNTMMVPAFSESGTWTVEWVLLNDAVGNSRYLTAADLANAGFPNSFTNSGVSDTTAPGLRSLSLSPSVINTAAGSQNIVVTARVTDDLAGTGVNRNLFEIRFRSPSGNQFVGTSMFDTDRISGNDLDGTYQNTMTVPAFSESGTWTVEWVLLNDAVGNSRYLTAADLANAGFPNSFTNSGVSDTTAPVLRSLSLSPSVINTAAGSQNIVVTARVTDDLAGTGVNRKLFEIRFRSPSGNQFVGTSMFDTDRISGNDLDGTYQNTMTVPAFSESGTWTVEWVLLNDAVGNSRYLTAADLANAGFPNSFTNN
jgi:hypothetical protein